MDLKQERRDSRQAATAFARICAEGDADNLYNASLRLDQCVDGWRPAMTRVAKLPRVSRKIQDEFEPIWVEHKHLPLTVGDRAVMAKALRILLRGGYTGPPLTLYRGTRSIERTRRRYGFSWSTEMAIARKFAEGHKHPGVKAIVLRTVAPPEAILLIRQPDEYYDEGEVVVDPFRLGRIEVVEVVQSLQS